MKDKGVEIVRLDLDNSIKLRIKGQIDSRMEDFGFQPGDYAALDLGFKVSDGWPVDKDCSPTLAEFVVLAKKLDMPIILPDLLFCPSEGDDGDHSATADNDRVYCKDCSSRYKRMDRLDVCLEQWDVEHTSIEPVYTYKLCCTSNVGNDCIYYTPKLWVRIKNKLQNIKERFSHGWRLPGRGQYRCISKRSGNRADN